MEHTDRTEKLRQLIFPALEIQNIDLVDLELRGKPGNQTLRIFIDCNDGVSLAICEKISREISDLLDTVDLIQNKYRLEISSPGIDRPLKNSKDFKRKLSQKVKVEYLDIDKKKKTVTGMVESVDENFVSIQTAEEIMQISFSNIQSAKILPLW